MKAPLLIFSLILAGSSSALSQSGRRVKEVRLPTPAVEEPSKQVAKPAAPEDAPPVTAERNQDYRCTDDGTLARILESETEQILSAKEVDTLAVTSSKPKPSYTKEARRNGVQGYVILKVVVSASGEIKRVRVVRRLPFGLTENAIRAACKLEFKPATKDGKAVSQWVNVEYVFRLADSSIMGP
jgi:TonB family protein